jgi:hypothetical protein
LSIAATLGKIPFQRLSSRICSQPEVGGEESKGGEEGAGGGREGGGEFPT